MLTLMSFYNGFVTYDLKVPRVMPDSKLQLPLDTVIHYMRDDGTISPVHDDYPMKYVKKSKVYQEDVTSITSLLGRPRLWEASTVHKELKRFRLDNLEFNKRLDVIMSELPSRRVGMVNYNPLFKLYKYPKNLFSNYYKYTNILTEMFSRISGSPKTNIVLLDFEKTTQSFDPAELKRRAKLKSDILKRNTNTLLEVFMNEFIFMILGKESLFDNMSNDDKVNVYFVFRNHGQLIVTNIISMLHQLGVIEDTKEIVNSKFRVKSVSTIRNEARYKIFNNLVDALQPKKKDPYEKKEIVKELQKQNETVVVEKGDIEKTVEDNVGDILTKLASSSAIPASKVATLKTRAKKALTLKSPLDDKVLLKDAGVVKQEEYNIASSKVETLPDAVDKDLTSTTIKEYDSTYIKNISDKHAMAVIHSFNSSGALVTGVNVEEIGSILGESKKYTVKFSPLDGVPSTLSFTLPVVEPDGTFTSNGTKYRMKKQHVDLPIRKVGPYEVYLSSYYGKLSIRRNNLASNSAEKWFGSKIPKVEGVSVLKDNVFDPSKKTPNYYAMLSMHFRVINYKKIELGFDLSARERYAGKLKLDDIEKGGRVVCGKSGKNPLSMDKEGNIDIYNNGKWDYFNTVAGIFDLDDNKIPKPFATLRSLGKEYPLILILIYNLGIDKVLKYTKVGYKIIGPKERYKDPHSCIIRFNDAAIVITKANSHMAMLYQGLAKYVKLTKTLEYNDFNHRNNEFPEGPEFLLMEFGLPIRYATEMDLIIKSFIDPITKDTLEAMGEPTNMIDLLLRGLSMLDHIHHPKMTDSKYMRERGYERLHGFVYKEVMKAIRSYKTAINPKKRGIFTISSFAISKAIIKDSTVSPVEDINPLSSLKESESITYLGEGGRSRETMNDKSRIFHENDIGLLSEAVPDSGSVGINASLSANPNIINTMGMHGDKPKSTTATNYSTSYLNTPGLDRDNPMRAVMSHIQQSHVVGIEGSKPSPVRTGMEYVLPHRVGGMYVNMAEEEGVVKEINEHGMVVKYKSGIKHIPLGTIEGYSEGKIYPHTLKTDLKVGDKVKKDDALSYNPMFFEKDTLLPNKLLYKSGKDITVAYLEGPAMNEDSCALYKDLAETFKSPVLYKLDYSVSFNDSVSRIPKVGSKIEAGDILFLIEDEITVDVVSEDSTNTLMELTRQSPRSEYTGVIERIEVLYNGDMSDMSPGLRNLAIQSNKRLIKKAKERGKNPYNGATYGELRVGGKVIGKNEAVIFIYIKSNHALIPGDKFVFASQLKATLGEILDVQPVSESGVKVDAMFSYKAAEARMATSAKSVPIANRILMYMPGYLKSKYF